MRKLFIIVLLFSCSKMYGQDVKKTPIRVYELKDNILLGILDSLNNSFDKCRFKNEHPEIYFKMKMDYTGDTINIILGSYHEDDSYFERLPNGILFYKNLRIHLIEYSNCFIRQYFCPTDSFTPWEISDKNYPFPLKKDYGYDSLDFFVRIVNSEVTIYKVIKCDD